MQEEPNADVSTMGAVCYYLNLAQTTVTKNKKTLQFVSTTFAINTETDS